jgi:hypothetical protein
MPASTLSTEIAKGYAVGTESLGRDAAFWMEKMAA